MEPIFSILTEPLRFAEITSREGQIASIVICVIIGVFSISIIWLMVRLIALNVKLLKHVKDYHEEKIENDPQLNIPWKHYRERFLSKEGIWQKTEDEASKYFNESAILSRSFNLRYWFALPGILVGIGILGTFLGLTFGIAEFNADPDEISNSINDLLGGMTTAFLTSIWGMSLSIIFNLTEKIGFQKTSVSIAKLSRELDRRFKLSKVDLIEFGKLAQEKLFKDFFSIEIDEKEVKPSIVFRELMLNSEQQTKALKSFSTDLADGIKISSETINQMGSSIGNALHSSFSKDLIPSLDNLKSVVEQLQDIKEQSSGEIIERVINNLQVSLDKMLRQIHESLSGSAITSLEKLSHVVAQAGSSLSTFPQQMEETMSQFRKEVSELQNNMKESILLVNKETAATTTAIRQETESSTKELSGSVASLQDNIMKMFQRQEESTIYVDELIGNFKNALSQNISLTNGINSSFDKFQDTLGNIDILSSKMIQSANVLQESSETLQSKSNSFEKQCNLFLNENQRTINQIEKVLAQAQNTAEDYATKFEVIRDGLKDIFQQIDSGLKDYQIATKESLNEYLKDFTDQMVNAANSLSGSIMELEEVFDAMHSKNTDQLFGDD